MNQEGLERIQTRAMNWSLFIGFALLVVKVTAYLITGSAAVLSDASESVVHVFAITFASFSLRLARKKPTEKFPFGFDRISFFSAGLEGALIIVAAVFILIEATSAFLAGRMPDQIGPGSLLTGLVIVVNGLLGFYLIRTGKNTGSLILEADGKHVLTDSITSVGALAGLGLAGITGLAWFDPLLAGLAGLNILREGFMLVRRGFLGLMDNEDPKLVGAIKTVVEEFCHKNGVASHELRIRDSGARLWVQLHLLFQDHVLLRDAHHIATHLELHLLRHWPQSQIITHLETLGDHDTIHHGSHPEVAPE